MTSVGMYETAGAFQGGESPEIPPKDPSLTCEESISDILGKKNITLAEKMAGKHSVYLIR